MKSSTRLALAVGAGYVLGRRRKMRLALILGSAAATGGFGGLTGQLLRRGGKLAGSAGALGKVAPELGEIGDMVRGELVQAGKAAALTAVRGRLDRVSDKLHDQAQALRPVHEGRAALEGNGAAGEPEDVEYAGDYEEPADEEDQEYEELEDREDEEYEEPEDREAGGYEEPVDEEDEEEEYEDSEESGVMEHAEDLGEGPEQPEEEGPGSDIDGHRAGTRSRRPPVRRTRR